MFLYVLYTKSDLQSGFGEKGALARLREPKDFGKHAGASDAEPPACLYYLSKQFSLSARRGNRSLEGEKITMKFTTKNKREETLEDQNRHRRPVTVLVLTERKYTFCRAGREAGKLQSDNKAWPSVDSR